MMQHELRPFLERCVFYPCSELDGAPVKLLGKKFQAFFYVDYFISRGRFQRECHRGGFRGYDCGTLIDIPLDAVFGSNWDAIKQEIAAIPELSGNLHWQEKPEQEFAALAKFNRLPGFGAPHGPESFSLLFASCEATLAYLAAFNQAGIAPECLCYIRPGIGFGGGYSEYPERLSQIIRQNRAGLPRHVLIDETGLSSEAGDYFPLITEYRQRTHFPYQTENYGDSKLTFASLHSVDG